MSEMSLLSLAQSYGKLRHFVRFLTSYRGKCRRFRKTALVLESFERGLTIVERCHHANKEKTALT